MAVQNTGNLEKDITELNNRISVFEKQFQGYKVEVIQNSKEDLDKMQSYVQTHDSWVIGIIGAIGVLAALFAYIWHRKVEKNLEKIEKIKTEIDDIEKSLDDKIEGELSEKVFRRFQEKEAEHMFRRLTEYDPGEISHFFSRLTTLHELKPDKYNVLMGLARKSPIHKGDFIILCLQFFPEKFVQDGDFRTIIMENRDYITSCFLVEILDGTKKIYEEWGRGDRLDKEVLQNWINCLKKDPRYESQIKTSIQSILKDLSGLDLEK